MTDLLNPNSLSQSERARTLFKASPSFGELHRIQEEPSVLEQERIRLSIENKLIENLKAPSGFQLVDILPTIAQGAELLAEDDFSRCFRENIPEPWNWNAYLYVLWCLGVVFRYGVILPIR